MSGGFTGFATVQPKSVHFSTDFGKTYLCGEVSYIHEGHIALEQAMAFKYACPNCVKVAFDMVKTLVRRWRFPQPQKQVVVKDPRVAKRALLGVSRVEAKLHKTEKELARLKAGLLKADKRRGPRQSNQDSGTTSAAPPA
jgi:hypothetical protein